MYRSGWRHSRSHGPIGFGALRRWWRGRMHNCLDTRSAVDIGCQAKRTLGMRIQNSKGGGEQWRISKIIIITTIIFFRPGVVAGRSRSSCERGLREEPAVVGRVADALLVRAESPPTDRNNKSGENGAGRQCGSPGTRVVRGAARVGETMTVDIWRGRVQSLGGKENAVEAEKRHGACSGVSGQLGSAAEF